jgi:hypothetical protein
LYPGEGVVAAARVPREPDQHRLRLRRTTTVAALEQQVARSRQLLLTAGFGVITRAPEGEQQIGIRCGAELEGTFEMSDSRLECVQRQRPLAGADERSVRMGDIFG